MRKCPVPPEHLRSEVSYLQHSKTLEKHENKEKLFELNV